jgi:hypothetical protein
MVLALKYDVTAVHLNNTMVLPNLYHCIDVAHGNTMFLNGIIHSTMVTHNYVNGTKCFYMVPSLLIVHHNSTMAV